MLKQFQQHITKKKLFKPTDDLLVAVSGGVDSMVLCNLLIKLGYSFSVAHCNFKMRGEDSEADEEFVTEFCQLHHLPLYKTQFNTAEYAIAEKISIQMAARQLRYNFFESVRNTHHLNYLLTAHHLNDSIETFFINLMRGAGIKGLRGIAEKQNDIIRPLLPFTKKEILEYATKNNISFREDSSNVEDKYLRNFLRLNIISQFSQLNPSFEKTIQKEIEWMQHYHSIIKHHFSADVEQAVSKTKTGITIKIETILNNSTPELLLFEILNDYGFNSKLISSIYESLPGISGKQFYSETHELLKDRTHLIIKERKKLTTETIFIEKDTSEIQTPIHLKFEIVKEFRSEKEINTAYIDGAKLVYPLKLRYWKQGDKFKPLGMAGYKKLSDLFGDLKLSNFQKKEVLILENGNNEIIWVVNVRIDDRYKITESTKTILRAHAIGRE